MTEIPLTKKIDRIEEALSEMIEGKKEKKKKFKLPLSINFGKGKLRKDYALVCLIRSNKQVQFKIEKVEDDTVMINDAIYDARSGNMLNYKKMPLLILKEWNTQPLVSEDDDEERKAEYKVFDPKSDYEGAEEYGNLTSPQRLIFTKMKMEAIRPRTNFDVKTIMVIIAMLGGVWFALDYFSILG